MEIRAALHLGDCNKQLNKLADNSVDLIVTSPPYADQRNGTYGGIHPDKYVEWFLPISKEMLRVLKPTGTFILNIKEKVVDGTIYIDTKNPSTKQQIVFNNFLIPEYTLDEYVAIQKKQEELMYLM